MKNNTSNPSAFNGAMTLRDYFAAKAMQGLIVGCEKPNDLIIAKWSYAMADAMLEEREKA
jgi:hypothetical protein